MSEVRIGGNPMTEAETTRLVSELYHAWIGSLQRREFAWFEDHLAADFVCTAQPFRNFLLGKEEFIEADKKVALIEVLFVEVTARRLGNIIVSSLLLKVQEERHASDLGEGLPTAGEISSVLAGKTIAYVSGWRHAAGRWQCFDHHMVGPTD